MMWREDIRSSEADPARQLGQTVAELLAASPLVSAVLIFGSVASGLVDTDSDLDVLVVCTDVPPAQVRRALTASLAATYEPGVSDDPLFGLIDILVRADGSRLELHYQSADRLERVIAQVFAGAITTPEVPFRPYTLLALLQRSWVLLDKNGTVVDWLERSLPYPPRLKDNLLKTFIPALEAHVAELTETAARGLGPRTFLFHLERGVDALSSVLLAVSEQYDPAEKRFEALALPLLERKPEQFDERLRDILTGPFDAAGMRDRAEAFRELATATLNLARG